MKLKDLITTSSKWDDEDPTVRLNALHTSAPEEAVLVRLAAEDPDRLVRCAAIALLESPSDVLRYLHEKDEELVATARDRFIALLNDTASRESAAAHLPSISDATLLRDTVVRGEDPQLRSLALARIDDEALLAELAIDCGLAQLRQEAVARVGDRELLAQIARDSQNRDKSVYRIAREKLGALQAEDDAQRALEERCRAVADALAQHAKSVHGPTFERKWRSLQDSWHALENEAAAGTGTAFVQTIETLRAQVDEANRACANKVAEAHAPEPQAQAPAPAPDTDEARAICDEIDGLIARMQAARPPYAEFRAALAELDTRWHALHKDGLDDAFNERYFKGVERVDGALAAEARFDAQSNTLSKLLADAGAQTTDVKSATRRELRRLLGRLHWPADFAGPVELATATAELARLDELQQRLSDEEQQRREALEGMLDTLDGVIAGGELKRAEKLFRDIQHARDQLRSRAFQHERVNQLSVKIRELRDWQGYATNPKREELCVRMEALAAEELHPRDRADRIKALQEEWKALGPSHSYKSQKLWFRFKEAGDRAYAPCIEYFQQQEAIRTQNLGEREKICDSLETFLAQSDWERANWKAVAEIIQTAKREWRRFENVSRSRRKGIQNRFHKVIDQLQAKLSAEQDRNRDRKRALIDEVAKLADESVELQAAINRTKTIQQEWKAVGITERKTDQALWTEFRGHCDAVFARREEQSRANKKEEADLSHHAEEICADLEAAVAAARESDDGSLTRGRLQQARRRFQEISVPQRSRRNLQARLDAVLRAGEEVLHARGRRAEQLELEELNRRANLCRLLECACPPAEVGSHIRSWDADAVHPLPGEVAQQINERWAYAQKVANGDAPDLDQVLSTNLRAAEFLCVRAELLAGIEPPREAQPIVMEYQVSRLKRELSLGEKETRSVAQQTRSLQLDWCCLGPVPAERIPSLTERFERAIGTLRGD